MRLQSLWPLGLLVAFLVITLTWGRISGDLAGLWPFFVCGLIAFALTTFRAPAKLYGPIWGTLVLIAYGIYVGAKSVTVIAPFSMPPERGASPYAFGGEMVAEAVHDSLASIANAASNQPSGLCAGRMDPSEIAVLRDAADIVLSADSLPSPKLEPLQPEIWRPSTAVTAPEPAVLEVNGVSLAAVTSTVRSILHSERVISGTVTMRAANSFLLVARSSNGEGPWVVGPFEATLAGLKQAGCAIGEKVLGDTNPNVLAQAYLNTGRARDVLELYEEHVPKPAKYSAEALSLKGAAKMQLSDYAGAVADLTAAYHRHSDPRVLESRALAYLGAGDAGSALNDLDAVLKSAPRSLRATNWYDHGVVYLLTKNYSKATDAFNNAVASDPTSVKAHYYLGAALDKSGRVQDASVAYRKAIDTEPTYPADTAVIRLQLGNTLDEMEKWPQALAAYRGTAKHFESIVARDPSNLGARSVLAVVLLRIASVQALHQLEDSGLAASEQAASELAEILKVSPEYEGARDYLARSYLIRGEMLFVQQKYDQAVEAAAEAMTTLVQETPSATRSTPWHILLTVVAMLRGNSYLVMGEAALARRDAEAALKVLAEVPAAEQLEAEAKTIAQWKGQAYMLRGNVLISTGQYADAVKDLKLALEFLDNRLEPSANANAGLRAAATSRLGVALMQEGAELIKKRRDLPEAERELREAINQFKAVLGSEKDAQTLLGEALWNLTTMLVLQHREQQAKATCAETLDTFSKTPGALTPQMTELVNSIKQACEQLAK